jgi:hypothetical protein
MHLTVAGNTSGEIRSGHKPHGVQIMNRNARMIGLISMVVVLDGYTAHTSHAQVSERFEAIRQSIVENGCLSNEILIDICAGGRAGGSGAAETHEDYNLLNGLPVCIRFTAESYSKSQRQLEGRFVGRRGAWGEEIHVTVGTSGVRVPSGVTKGTLLLAKGNLFKEGNEFYGNLIDNCFIQFNGESVEIDGF